MDEHETDREWVVTDDGGSTSDPDPSKSEGAAGGRPSEAAGEDDRIPVASPEHREASVAASSALEDGADTEGPDEAEYLGPEPSDRIIEPGSPSLENAIFVVIGAIAMLLIMFRLGSILVI